MDLILGRDSNLFHPDGIQEQLCKTIRLFLDGSDHYLQFSFLKFIRKESFEFFRIWLEFFFIPLF